MKKHPVIKFSLIMIISAAFGALCSSLLSNHTDSITGAVGAFNRWFGAQTATLHISVCLFLSLMAAYFTHKIKNKLKNITPENEEEIYEWAETQSNPVMMICALCVILNFFFLGASICYLIPKNILISAVAALIFICITTWLEVSQVNLMKQLNPKLKEIDPLSVSFMKQIEKQSDEAETFEMYRAAYHSFKNLKYVFVFAFAVCCMIQLFYPIGLIPFILIAVFWGIHSLSFVNAFGKKSK